MRKNKNKNKTEVTAYDNALISWIAPQSVRYERGKLWKVTMGLTVLALIIWGIFYDAWTFSLAIGAFVLAYYFVHLDHPRDIEIKISRMGIKVGSRKYAYSRIKAFWLIYNPPYVKTLNLRVDGELVQDLTIQLDDQSPEDLRELLLKHIPELEGQNEKIMDIILRLLKI